jgi:hypothetical protein
MTGRTSLNQMEPPCRLTPQSNATWRMYVMRHGRPHEAPTTLMPWTYMRHNVTQHAIWHVTTVHATQTQPAHATQPMSLHPQGLSTAPQEAHMTAVPGVAAPAGAAVMLNKRTDKPCTAVALVHHPQQKHLPMMATCAFLQVHTTVHYTPDRLLMLFRRPTPGPGPNPCCVQH